MYGMVNQAIESMVTENFGPDAWEEVKARAHVEEPVFVAMKQYPDEVTYALATAVSEQLGKPLPEILHAFGRYWITYAQRGPWGKVMMNSGRNTRELLGALDAMHARIAVSFPELRPPSFHVSDSPNGTMVEYRTHRAGLAPFVVGLIEGIGQMFHEDAQVTQVASREAGAPHDRFLVRIAPSA
jgi:hypothetical protein